MVKVIKLFVFTAALLVAAFIANFFGLLSIPWLDVNSVATYGDHAIRADEAVQKIHDQ